MTTDNETGEALHISSKVREGALQSVEQSREAFDKFLSAAQSALQNMQRSGHDVQDNSLELSRKTLTYVEQNVSAVLDHAQKLIGATDFQSIVNLQSQYALSQFAVMQEQARQLNDSFKHLGTSVRATAAAVGPFSKAAAASAAKKDGDTA